MIGIGINTGTSADAIDVAIVEFGRVRCHPSIKLLWSGTFRYPSALKRLFLKIVDHTNKLTPSTWFAMAGQFDFGLGSAFSDAALKAINASAVKKSSIAFVGLHGQTVWHEPKPQRFNHGRPFATGSTIQLGNPSVVAVRTGIPVVAHFREKDIVLGGQGAPLAPVLHYELFRENAPAVVLNIGGIANITVIPSHSDFSRVYGFDTGPGNRLIDTGVEAYTNGKKTFDKDGRFADSGIVDMVLLKAFMRDSFVRKHPPKSTGRERYNKAYLNMHNITFDDINIISTLTAFTAHSIVYNIRHFVKNRIERIIVCGGGAHNGAIMRHLSGLMPNTDIRTVEEYGYKSYVIEPMLFAYLGYLGLNGIPVRLTNITGSSSAFVPGGIYYP